MFLKHQKSANFINQLPSNPRNTFSLAQELPDTPPGAPSAGGEAMAQEDADGTGDGRLQGWQVDRLSKLFGFHVFFDVFLMFLWFFFLLGLV